MNKSASVIDPLKELDEAGEFPPIWSPEEGEKIQGTIRRYSDTELEKSGHTWICAIQTSASEVLSVFLSPTVLKSEFAKKKPKVGERIIIKFLGTPKGKAYKKFVVSLPDRPDAASVPDWNELDPDQANYNESVPDDRGGPYASQTVSRTSGGAAVAERQAVAVQQPGSDEEDPFLEM